MIKVMQRHRGQLVLGTRRGCFSPAAEAAHLGEVDRLFGAGMGTGTTPPGPAGDKTHSDYQTGVD